MSWIRTSIEALISIQGATMIFTGVGICIYFWQGQIYAAQLSVAQDTERRQLRAYVGVELVDFQQAKGDLLAVLPIKNFGLTPATDLNIHLVVDTRRKDLIHVYPRGDTPPQDDHIHQPIFPSATIYWYNTFNLNRGDLYDWRTYKTVVLVFGSIDYKDVFDNQHSVPFCGEFTAVQIDEARLKDSHTALQCNINQ